MDNGNNESQGNFKILLTILLPVSAVIIPIALYMLQAKNKDLTYEIYSYSLINSSSSIKDEIEINFSGEKVTDLSAVNIEIKNVGDVPILKEDFEKDIIISFGKDARILKTSLERKTPSNLIPIINNTKDNIQVSPLLLNSGDKFSIEAIISKPVSEPEFDARIAGIKTPTKISRELYSGRFVSDSILITFIFVFLMLYGFLSFFSLVLLRPFIKKQNLIEPLPLGVLAILSCCCGAYFLVVYRIHDFSISSLPEILLYILALTIGMALSIATTKGIRSRSNSKNNEDNG